ncbi:MAG: DUF1304 family protein [Alloprevotella sp.]
MSLLTHVLVAIVAALYGTVRSSRSIFFKQGLPAIFAILAVLLSRFC